MRTIIPWRVTLASLLVLGAVAEADVQQPRTLEGGTMDPLVDASSRAVVLAFVAADCPISNRYVPALNTLFSAFSTEGIRFWTVYPNPGVTAEDVRKHQTEFQFNLPALLDPGHVLVARVGVVVTPEVAVFVPAPDGDGPMRSVYRGRIDDQYFDFGKWRPEAGTHDARAVLEAVVRGERLEPRVTRAVGCYIVK